MNDGLDGESAGTRTQDQRLKRAMLYQLSYALEPHSNGSISKGPQGGGRISQAQLERPWMCSIAARDPDDKQGRAGQSRALYGIAAQGVTRRAG